MNQFYLATTVLKCFVVFLTEPDPDPRTPKSIITDLDLDFTCTFCHHRKKYLKHIYIAASAAKTFKSEVKNSKNVFF